MIRWLLGFLVVSNLVCADLYQPQFIWADGSSTLQGKGSFVKTPTGEVVGLTSAHFIDFSGPNLLEVRWLNESGQPVATSVRSWGRPGRSGDFQTLDLRPDYFLAVVEGDFPTYELDEREHPEVGERVWFGCDEGRVTSSKATHIEVLLDQKVGLKGRSGTPIISQNSGKIIGILAGGRGRTIYLTPATSIREAISKASCTPLLRQAEVIDLGQTGLEPVTDGL